VLVHLFLYLLLMLRIEDRYARVLTTLSMLYRVTENGDLDQLSMVCL